VAVAYWIGALIPLALLLTDKSKGVWEVVRTWSTGAVVAVSTLALTGVVLAWVQVQTSAALVGTAYGQILRAKLGLLGLAAANRYRLTPALATGTRAEGRLAISAAVEIGLALIIFGLVGLWRFTPPPRALEREPAATQPAVAHLHTDAAMADVTLTPGRVGKAGLRIVLPGHSGPLEPKEATVRLANQAAGVEPIEWRTTALRGGVWEAKDLVLPVPVSWQVSIDVLMTDFENAVLQGNIDVKS
jgi:copper transport protein